MRSKKLAIGLMTGSSMDGIDGAILETDGMFQVKHITGASYEYSNGFKKALRLAEYAMQQENGDIIAAANNFATHLDKFLSQNALAAKNDISNIAAEFDLSFNVITDRKDLGYRKSLPVLVMITILANYKKECFVLKRPWLRYLFNSIDFLLHREIRILNLFCRDVESIRKKFFVGQNF